MTFFCDQCGLCCKHIAEIPALNAFDQGNGVCNHLKGNLCEIYETRPEICRIETMYRLYFSELYSEEEFYKLNRISCEYLKKMEEIENE